MKTNLNELIRNLYCCIISSVLFVGLTGNYGMGKSTVLPLFMKLGAVIIDTDKIVESLLKEKPVLEKIRVLFGDAVFLKNGSLDKKKVAGVVFNNDGLRHSLEDILHPLVFERIDLLFGEMKGEDKVMLVEIPLLYERDYEGRFNRTITVYTSEETALARLEKEGISQQEALLRLQAQLPIEEKIRRSDFIIDNNGTIEETMSQVEKVYKELYEEAKKNGNNTRARKPDRELS
jgi:dephospho-CoA kinase